MSPSIASIVTPLRSPTVLSMSSSFPRRLVPGASRLGKCLALSRERYVMRALRRARSLLHASRNALLLVLAQRFLRVELPAALLTLEDFHRVPPWSRA